MKQKTLHVDFNDSTLGTIAREGEHNRTQLVFVLDEDLQACDFINVEFGIESSGEKLVLENLCPEEGDNTLKVSLTQDVTVSGALTIQLVGYVIDSETAEPRIIAKSPVVSGVVTPSINGIEKVAQGVAGLLDRILAKLHVLIEKAHTHFNKSILDRFGEDEHGGLIYDGKEISSGGIQSLTAFPEVAKDGDVVLLHRCNEITPDDSNSGVILDTDALASLTLPEGMTDRIWNFEAPNPTGTGFMLTLEQRVIEDDEPYVLTGISLASENYAGRWYWREGKPYYDISNASTEPIPALIPLGKVSGFTATKDPLIDEDYDEHEDTDNTTIFRTVPREYMYSGGEWKLTERTDIAEGNLISNFGEIEKDGQKFFRLDLTDSRSLKNRNKKAVDIPIEGVKKTTTTVGGITLESEEIVFPKAEAGGIKSVSALPTVANEGDVVYYCPPANTLTSADSGHKILLNNNWANESPVPENVLTNRYDMKSADNKTIGGLTFYKNSTTAKLTANGLADWLNVNHAYVLTEGTYVFSPNDSYVRENGSSENIYISCELSYFTLPVFEKFVKTKEDVLDCIYFYAVPRFYRYTNGEWVEILTPEVGGIDKVETNAIETTTLQPNVFYDLGISDTLTLNFAKGAPDKVNEYLFSFISGETATVLTLPSSVKWVNELTVEPNKRYEISIVDNVALWCAVDYEVTE